MIDKRALRPFRVAVAALAVTTATAPVAAQDTVFVPRTIGELLALGAAQSPELRGAAIARDAAKSNVTAAKLQRLPTPNVTLEGGEGRGAANVTLFGPIYDFGQAKAGVKLARGRLDLADVKIAQAGFDISLRLVDLLQTWLVNSRRAEAQKRALDLLLDLEAMADRRMEAGFATQSETYLVQSRIAQASSEMRAAEAQALSARRQIEQVVGQPVDLGRIPIEGGKPALLADLLLRANDRALAVETAKAEAKISATDAELARAQRLPVMGVAAERNDFSLVGGRVEYRIVARVTVAPGAGFSSFARAKAASQSAAAAAFSISTAQRNAAMAVTGEYNVLSANRARLPEAVAALDATREVVASYRRLFVAGKRSWLDLLNSARELTQAEIAVSDLQSAVAIGDVRLALISGERLWEAQ